ncbi:MAG TPA: sensor histidine kinase [Longimicrobium sp.]|nr:sensor histidine kinase [Longimicrobium sp.]
MDTLAHPEGAPTPRRPRLLPPDDNLGWTPYVWLIYLTFFLVDPFVRLRNGAMGPEHAVATVVGLLVFLPSYFRGYWVRGRALLPVIGVQALLGVALTPLNLGASVFLIYASSFAGNLEPTRNAVRAIVAIAALGAATSWLVDAPPWYWWPAAGMPLIIGYVNIHGAQVRRANARLRLAHERIEHLAAVAERERIARDLHDLLGHTLSLIVLKSELAAKLTSRDAARAEREIRDVEQVARTALREVREAIRGYRASLADEVGRSRALLTAADIRADIESEPVEFAREVEEALALALREAVTNVVRHARAASCRVRLRADGAWYTLEVEDDGRGGGAAEGSGLRGMRERVEAVGGTLRRGRGAGGAGTLISARVPMAPATASADAGIPAAAERIAGVG